MVSSIVMQFISVYSTIHMLGARTEVFTGC